MSHNKSKIRGGDRSIMGTNPGGGTCCCPPACWTRSLACCGSRPEPLVSTDNYYDDDYYDDYVMSSCPPGSCRCPGQSGACLPGCCGTLPGEGGGQCLGGRCFNDMEMNLIDDGQLMSVYDCVKCGNAMGQTGQGGNVTNCVRCIDHMSAL